MEDTFDFSDVIDDLPAASFLWYNQVKHDPIRRREYLQCLSKLVFLFLAPHYVNVDSFDEQPSFLKKYEALSRNSRRVKGFLKSVVELLSLRNPNVKIVGKSGVSLERPTAKNNGSVPLKSKIENWYLHKPEPTLIMYLTTTEREKKTSHTCLLVLQKHADHVKLLFLNFKLLDSLEENEMFVTNLKQELQTILNQTRIEEVSTPCPFLQTLDQGPNCVQWFLLTLALLIQQPNMFDSNTPTLLNQLERHATLNVLLFELAIFLRTMPVIGLRDYYYAIFLRENTDYIAYNNEVVDYDIDSRNYLFPRFSQVDCTQEQDTCSGQCIKCPHYCTSILLSKVQEDQSCSIMTPKEIAREMFKTYLSLRGLTGLDQEQLDAMDTAMAAQLDFQEATSLQDYVDMNLLTLEQVTRIQQQDQEEFWEAMKEQEQERPQKRKKEDDDEEERHQKQKKLCFIQ